MPLILESSWAICDSRPSGPRVTPAEVSPKKKARIAEVFILESRFPWTVDGNRRFSSRPFHCNPAASTTFYMRVAVMTELLACC